MAPLTHRAGTLGAEAHFLDFRGNPVEIHADAVLAVREPTEHQANLGANSAMLLLTGTVIPLRQTVEEAQAILDAALAVVPQDEGSEGTE